MSVSGHAGLRRTAAQVGPSDWQPSDVEGEYAKKGAWGEAGILGQKYADFGIRGTVPVNTFRKDGFRRKSGSRCKRGPPGEDLCRGAGGAAPTSPRTTTENAADQQQQQPKGPHAGYGERLLGIPMRGDLLPVRYLNLHVRLSCGGCGPRASSLSRSDAL